MIASRLHLLARMVGIGIFSSLAFSAKELISQEAQPPQVGASNPSSNEPESEKLPEPSPGTREQTIYIPYAKLRDVFEREGRGVFLPYEKFQELWNAARDKTETKPSQLVPVDSIISEADSEATVQQDVVVVDAILKIELLKKGWNKIPLRLSDAAIRSATIDGHAARIISQSDGQYVLLIENKEGSSAQIELKLQYARAFTKSPGKNSVSFQSPQAPVNRWRIRIPQTGVKISVQPLIAATELPDPARSAANPDEASKDGGKASAPQETVVLAFVGAAPEVRVDWTAKSEGASGLTALATVQSQQAVFIDEGVVRTNVHLKYEISRAQLSQLVIEVPDDQKIVNVYDTNVRKWEVTRAEKIQRVTVELFEPATNLQNLSIEMEKNKEDRAKQDWTAPVIKAIDVGRQQGIIVVNIAPTLRAEATVRTGLLQLDASDLPPELKTQTWSFAYRYSSLPFDLRLGVDKVEPRISIDQLIEVYVEPEQALADLVAIYSIEQAGVFQLEFKIPDGFDVRQVRGHAVADASPVAVDAFNVAADDKTRLTVTLSRKAIGRVGLRIELHKRLSDANLLAPTGTAATITVPIPQANQKPLERASGRLVVHAPENLRINPATPTGLRTIPISEAYSGMPSIREARFPNSRPVLAFAFTDQPASLDLSAERRKPLVTARQRLAVRFDSGVVKYETRLFYEILYSGVKSLRVDVPMAIASGLRNPGPLRETPIEPPPTDVAEGYVAWNFTGTSELIGNQKIALTWEQKIGELEVGKSIDISVPHLKPMGAERAWGQIVVTKNETLDVEPKGATEGLRPIDPQHDVMPDARLDNAARAFEFHDAWTLNLTATRYQLEEVKRTSIERAMVRTVVTRSGQLGVQALYRVRSARQRLTVKLPSDIEFDAQPLRINGAPVTLERGDQSELFVPLVGQSPDRPFVLELRYTRKGTFSNLDLPEFPEDPAVQKVYQCVFLPKELLLVDSLGPWSDQWMWSTQQSLKRLPVLEQNDDQLEAWVAQGVSVAAGPAFQKDGTLYVYSALKPASAPAGSLKLRAIDEKLLAGAVFGALAIVGIVWLVRPLVEKVYVVALMGIAVFVCGVFLPTLAQQLLNLPTFAAVGGVGFLWSAMHIGRGLKSLNSRFSANSPPHTKTSGSDPVFTATNTPAHVVEANLVSGGKPGTENHPATDATPGAVENKGDQHHG